MKQGFSRTGATFSRGNSPFSVTWPLSFYITLRGFVKQEES